VRVGVWMSRGVWAHKCDASARRQTWNLRAWPESAGVPRGPGRLYVAIRRHWRGYFRVEAFSWHPADHAAPYTLVFDPRSWTPIPPVPSPSRDRALGYTLDVPGDSPDTAGGTR
jgi:hypothetical protein